MAEKERVNGRLDDVAETGGESGACPAVRITVRGQKGVAIIKMISTEEAKLWDLAL